MKQRRDVLYNIMLPLWLLLFWPSVLWLVLIPLNYLIDRIVLKWSLGDMPDKGRFCRKHTWKICLTGFFADFVGILLLFAAFLAGGYFDESTSIGGLFEKLAYGVGYNPYSHPLAFLLIALSVLVAGLLICALDGVILRKAGLSPAEAKKSALRLAVCTAPYLYFVPSFLLYETGFFTI